VGLVYHPEASGVADTCATRRLSEEWYGRPIRGATGWARVPLGEELRVAWGQQAGGDAAAFADPWRTTRPRPPRPHGAPPPPREHHVSPGRGAERDSACS